MKLPTEIQLQWPICRDGYGLTERYLGERDEKMPIRWVRPADKAPMQFIEARSDALDNHQPLDEHPGLFQTFARLEPSPDAFVTFCNSYGSLADGSTNLDVVRGFHECLREAIGLPVRHKLYKFSPRGQGRNLDSMVTPVHQMTHGDRGLLREQIRNLEAAAYSTGRFSAAPMPYIEHLGVLVKGGCVLSVDRDDATGRARLVARPINLLVGLALQTLKHLSGDRQASGIEVIVCKRCERTFEAGTGTGKRTRAMYCSKKCQNSDGYARRKTRAELPG